jgi:xanthine dehydrogenase accessory factor
MLAAISSGTHCGSLSGGCVEEDFLQGIAHGDHAALAQVVSYGKNAEERDRLRLPCGGSLEVLVERREPSASWIAHLEATLEALRGQRRLRRVIDLRTGDFSLGDMLQSQTAVCWEGQRVEVGVGPALRLILAGLSPVAQACGEFARALGFEVVACDPRQEVRNMTIPGVELLEVLPSEFIAQGGCHGGTAVVALTHDPRIDDLAMMEAVRTQAFYIGVMGSVRTSANRAERLKRVGGLSIEEVHRIHMPIGLNIGSRTPAEIALSILADVLRVYRGKERSAL